MKRAVIREAGDDFGAFKICEAALKLGGDVVSVTISPNMVFDHVQGHQKPDGTGRHRWIVWMTFGAAFDVDSLDKALSDDEA